MIERLIRPTVRPEDQDDVYRSQLAAEWRRVDPQGVAALEQSAAALDERLVDYPDQYRACGICKVKIGEKCVSRSGKVVNGHPDGVRTELDHPHNARRKRTRRAK